MLLLLLIAGTELLLPLLPLLPSGLRTSNAGRRKHYRTVCSHSVAASGGRRWCWVTFFTPPSGSSDHATVTSGASAAAGC
uniref:Putative secreted protein n=1 Tax=Anopheles triannulatus TaxID=58253 RepID=A0A2M4B7B5_9DIPT